MQNHAQYVMAWSKIMIVGGINCKIQPLGRLLQQALGTRPISDIISTYAKTEADSHLSGTLLCQNNCKCDMIHETG